MPPNVPVLTFSYQCVLLGGFILLEIIWVFLDLVVHLLS